MKQMNVEKAKGVENPPGVTRKTLSYNDDVMLCHFFLKKGATIPLHSHEPSQIGYVVSGRARFLAAVPEGAFEASAGDSYVFGPNVKHGTEAIEDTVYIEVFSPVRDEFKDF